MTIHDDTRRDVNRQGRHILMRNGTEPHVWSIDGSLFQLGDPVRPCDVWALIDHAAAFGLSVCADSDVLGILRAAGADCDEALGGVCGCGLLYGKYPLEAGHDDWQS